MADPEVAKILQTKETKPTKDPVTTEGYEMRQSVGPLFTRIDKAPQRQIQPQPYRLTTGIGEGEVNFDHMEV